MNLKVEVQHTSCSTEVSEQRSLFSSPNSSSKKGFPLIYHLSANSTFMSEFLHSTLNPVSSPHFALHFALHTSAFFVIIIPFLPPASIFSGSPLSHHFSLFCHSFLPLPRFNPFIFLPHFPSFPLLSLHDHRPFSLCSSFSSSSVPHVLFKSICLILMFFWSTPLWVHLLSLLKIDLSFYQTDFHELCLNTTVGLASLRRVAHTDHRLQLFKLLSKTLCARVTVFDTSAVKSLVNIH